MDAYGSLARSRLVLGKTIWKRWKWMAWMPEMGLFESNVALIPNGSSSFVPLQIAIRLHKSIFLDKPWQTKAHIIVGYNIYIYYSFMFIYSITCHDIPIIASEIPLLPVLCDWLCAESPVCRGMNTTPRASWTSGGSPMVTRGLRACD